MAITDEDRARLGELAMEAIDQILERYGEDAQLRDVVLIYEVGTGEQGGQMTEVNGVATTPRPSVQGGIAQVFANMRLQGWVDGD